jgi:hypothetical protein
MEEKRKQGGEAGVYFDAQLGLWRSTSLITWGLSLFAAFCLLMGVIDFFGDRLLLAGVLFSCSAVSFAGLAVAQTLGYHTGAKWYFIVPILGLFFFLLLHGGVEQTGLFWCLAFLPGLLYLLGYRWGAVLLSLMAATLAAIFVTDAYLWGGNRYSPVVEGRFLLVFVGLGLFSLGQDYLFSRQIAAVGEGAEPPGEG